MDEFSPVRRAASRTEAAQSGGAKSALFFAVWHSCLLRPRSDALTGQGLFTPLRWALVVVVIVDVLFRWQRAMQVSP